MNRTCLSLSKRGLNRRAGAVKRRLHDPVTRGMFDRREGLVLVSDFELISDFESVSDFEFVSDFEIRISCFGSNLTCRQLVSQFKDSSLHFSPLSMSAKPASSGDVPMQARKQNRAHPREKDDGQSVGTSPGLFRHGACHFALCGRGFATARISGTPIRW
jgi:hypothetical protein